MKIIKLEVFFILQALFCETEQALQNYFTNLYQKEYCELKSSITLNAIPTSLNE